MGPAPSEVLPAPRKGHLWLGQTLDPTTSALLMVGLLQTYIQIGLMQIVAICTKSPSDPHD
jgi:hypothetical protein